MFIFGYPGMHPIITVFLGMHISIKVDLYSEVLHILKSFLDFRDKWSLTYIEVPPVLAYNEQKNA